MATTHRQPNKAAYVFNKITIQIMATQHTSSDLSVKKSNTTLAWVYCTKISLPIGHLIGWNHTVLMQNDNITQSDDLSRAMTLGQTT